MDMLVFDKISKAINKQGYAIQFENAFNIEFPEHGYSITITKDDEVVHKAAIFPIMGVYANLVHDTKHQPIADLLYNLLNECNLAFDAA